MVGEEGLDLLGCDERGGLVGEGRQGERRGRHTSIVDLYMAKRWRNSSVLRVKYLYVFRASSTLSGSQEQLGRTHSKGNPATLFACAPFC